MRPLIVLALILLLFPGCGGSDQQNPIPAAATILDSKLTAFIASSMPDMASFDGIMVGILIPGTPLAQGVALTPDPNPVAPPFSFTFNAPYDIDGDGLNETTLSGEATFSSDPAVAWSGVMWASYGGCHHSNRWPCLSCQCQLHDHVRRAAFIRIGHGYQSHQRQYHNHNGGSGDTARGQASNRCDQRCVQRLRL